MSYINSTVGKGGVFGHRSKSNPAMFIPNRNILHLGILVRGTRDEIDKNQNHHRDDEDGVGLPPLLAEVSEQPRLTAAAIVTESGPIVAPDQAIRVDRRVLRVRPCRRAFVPVTAGGRRFAAT